MTKRTVEEFVKSVRESINEIKELYLSDCVPWLIGCSWGKDSSTILQLIWTAIEQIPISQRHKKIYVMTTDTLVENPIVATWVKNSIKKLQQSAIDRQMPFEAHLLNPAIKDTFWTCLIGKGYAAPRRGFRWCTSRMKISPVNEFIKYKIQAYGESIVVLGTRHDESAARSATMTKHEKGRVRDKLSPNGSLANSLVYTPIENWTTEEVWIYLMQFSNPWGGDNQNLFKLYRGATADNECPLVVDTSTPSCGASRFGCWTCTMVSKDRSMQAMINNDEEKEWLQPLLDIRNELDIENDHDRRDWRRMHGRVDLYERKTADGESTEMVPTPGPYLKIWREHWLKLILTAQMQIQETAPAEYRDLELISILELHEIRRIWLEDKHEFDDSLPRIYKEITGETFQVQKKYEKQLLGNDEWQLLQEICGDDVMQLELLTKLLSTEQSHENKSRRGIYENLEKSLNSSSRSKEEAFAVAIENQTLRKTVEKKDTNAVKQMTFAQLKFNKENNNV